MDQEHHKANPEGSKAKGIWLYQEDVEALADLQKHFDCSASAVVRQAISLLYEEATK